MSRVRQYSLRQPGVRRASAHGPKIPSGPNAFRVGPSNTILHTTTASSEGNNSVKLGGTSSYASGPVPAFDIADHATPLYLDVPNKSKNWNEITYMGFFKKSQPSPEFYPCGNIDSGNTNGFYIRVRSTRQAQLIWYSTGSGTIHDYIAPTIKAGWSTWTFFGVTYDVARGLAFTFDDTGFLASYDISADGDMDPGITVSLKLPGASNSGAGPYGEQVLLGQSVTKADIIDFFETHRSKYGI